MKFIAERPCADPEKAARKILEIANGGEPVQDGRIHIEKINGPFLIQSWRQPGRIRCRNETRHRGRLARDA